jgi:hypothetical protein
MHGQSLARNQARPKLRQFPFGLSLEMPEKLLGDHKLKNRIAQKFEPLIIEMMALRFVAQTRMRQRFREQKRIPKFVTDAVFERIH